MKRLSSVITVLLMNNDCNKVISKMKQISNTFLFNDVL